MLGGSLIAASLVACSVLFDVPDTPRPPTRRLRRDLFQEIEQLKRQVAEVKAREAAAAQKAIGPPERALLPVEQATTWAEAVKLLPVTTGMPDWAKALADGVINPRAGLDPTVPDQPVFPLDIEMVPADNPTYKAVFSHQIHTAVLACTNCHPAIFQMAGGGDPIPMEKIYAGESCGQCHGKVAFAAPTGCPRCHPALGGQ
jgi:c(7)-type cytochrome triheme protein